MDSPTSPAHRIAGPMAEHGMTRFDVFAHAAERYEAVKIGFSWPAFFFTLFWAFFKRLWRHAIIALSFIVLLAIVPGFEEFEQRSFGNGGLGLILGLLFGFKGNEWRRRRLEVLGWRLVASVEADNPSQAIATATERAALRQVRP